MRNSWDIWESCPLLCWRSDDDNWVDSSSFRQVKAIEKSYIVTTQNKTTMFFQKLKQFFRKLLICLTTLRQFLKNLTFSWEDNNFDPIYFELLGHNWSFILFYFAWFFTGFVELSLADQIHLLKCCWLEILMLGLMWRSVDHPGKLIFSPDFKLSRWENFLPSGITSTSKICHPHNSLCDFCLSHIACKCNLFYCVHHMNCFVSCMLYIPAINTAD